MNKILIPILLLIGYVNCQAQSAITEYVDAANGKKIKEWASQNSDLDQMINVDGQKMTALSYAALKQNAEALGILIQKGANTKKMVEGMDPLMYAAKGGNMECVEMLLKAGANFTNENKQGQTAKDIAVKAGHTDIAKLLENEMNAYYASFKKKTAK